MMTLISKKQFLEEHNKLSPPNLKATFALLTKFQQEKKPLLKDNAWCLDKHRIPFISWMNNLPKKPASAKASASKQTFKNYPETHYED